MVILGAACFVGCENIDPSDYDTTPISMPESHSESFYYSICFNSNGGTGYMEQIQLATDETYTLSANEFKRSLYTFTSWNTQADGNGISYADKATVKNLTTKGNVFYLYAQWEKIETQKSTLDPEWADRPVITIDLSESDTLEIPTEYKYCQIVVTGEYGITDWYNLVQKIEDSPAYLKLDLSALTGVKTLSSYLSDKEKLVSLVLPDAWIEIAEKALEGCANLTSVTISDSTTSIGKSAFAGCTNLASITLGENVQTIGSHAFENCGLTDIEIPDNVTSIGSYVFSGCTNLESISIGASLTDINYNYFSGCSSLSTVTISEQNKNYQSIDNIVYSKNGKTLVFCPAGLVGDVIIDSAVTKISSYAFADCKKLETITVPAKTSIGSYAFSSCGTVGTTNIVLEEGRASIELCAFYNCTGIASITIPNSVTSIESNAFQSCSGLTTVKIGEKVKTINSHAFQNCTSLESFEIPMSVTTIASYAFDSCTALSSVIFEDINGWWVSSYAFKDTLLTVSDASQNAKYLTNKYRDCKWYKKDY